MATNNLKKIDIAKIDRKEGFDTFDLIRNGGDLDEQKVAAVFKYLVDTVNQLTETVEALKGIILKEKGKAILNRKGVKK